MDSPYLRIRVSLIADSRLPACGLATSCLRTRDSGFADWRVVGLADWRVLRTHLMRCAREGCGYSDENVRGWDWNGALVRGGERRQRLKRAHFLGRLAAPGVQVGLGRWRGGRWRGALGQRLKRALSCDFSCGQMTLDPPHEDVAGIVIVENLVMGIEAVTIHFHVEAGSSTLRTNLHLSALDSRSHWKNRVVRDQSVSLLIFECSLRSALGNARSLLLALTGTQYSDYRRHGQGWEDHTVNASLRGYPRAVTKVGGVLGAPISCNGGPLLFSARGFCHG